jgi:hypothetical protein
MVNYMANVTAEILIPVFSVPYYAVTRINSRERALSR